MSRIIVIPLPHDLIAQACEGGLVTLALMLGISTSFIVPSAAPDYADKDVLRQAIKDKYPLAPFLQGTYHGLARQYLAALLRYENEYTGDIHINVHEVGEFTEWLRREEAVTPVDEGELDEAVGLLEG